MLLMGCAGVQKQEENRGDKERRNVIPQQRLSVASLILLAIAQGRERRDMERWDMAHQPVTSTHKKKKEIIIHAHASLIDKEEEEKKASRWRHFGCMWRSHLIAGLFPILYFEKNKIDCDRCVCPLLKDSLCVKNLKRRNHPMLHDGPGWAASRRATPCAAAQGEKEMWDGVISSSLDPAPFSPKKISSSFVAFGWILSGSAWPEPAGAGQHHKRGHERKRRRRRRDKKEGGCWLMAPRQCQIHCIRAALYILTRFSFWL